MSMIYGGDDKPEYGDTSIDFVKQFPPPRSPAIAAAKAGEHAWPPRRAFIPQGCTQQERNAPTIPAPAADSQEGAAGDDEQRKSVGTEPAIRSMSAYRTHRVIFGGVMFLLGLLLLNALLGCTQPDTATRVLQDAGYTNVKLQGYDWLNCSKDDTYHDKFTATGPNGRPVSGVVCAGFLFKGSTIRLD